MTETKPVVKLSRVQIRLAVELAAADAMAAEINHQLGQQFPGHSVTFNIKSLSLEGWTDELGSGVNLDQFVVEWID